MKLHFLKYDALASLRANVEGNLEKYRLPVNDWIYEFFGEEEPFGEFMTTVGDISLVCTEKEQGKADVQNVITLYSAMMNITDTQASDERLWAGMCHGDMWEFLNKRWEASSSKKITKEDVLSRYFYGQGRRRSLITNTLAKLWWVGRLTYDPDRKDPYLIFEQLHEQQTCCARASQCAERPGAQYRFQRQGAQAHLPGGFKVSEYPRRYDDT